MIGNILTHNLIFYIIFLMNTATQQPGALLRKAKRDMITELGLDDHLGRIFASLGIMTSPPKFDAQAFLSKRAPGPDVAARPRPLREEDV
jgi:hypothetical protein